MLGHSTIRSKIKDERHFSDPKAITGHIPVGWLYITSSQHRSWNSQEVKKSRLLCIDCAANYESITDKYFKKTP